MALSSHGGGIGRMYLMRGDHAIALGGRQGRLFPRHFCLGVRRRVGRLDGPAGGTAPNRLRAVTPHFNTPGLCLSRN